MTPAAMPDGPPSRKGPLRSGPPALSVPPALCVYCKDALRRFLWKEIQKPRPALHRTPEPVPKNLPAPHAAHPLTPHHGILPANHVLSRQISSGRTGRKAEFCHNGTLPLSFELHFPHALC